MIVLIRKHKLIEHKKVVVINVNFDKLDEYSEQLIAEDVFCCLGTTIKKAKSKENFKKVDLHYPVNLASLTKINGARQFLVISSVGANSHSKIFYSKVKGLMENELKKIGFSTLRIFRPSLLLGKREEFRFGEKMGTVLYNIISWMFVGCLKRYKGIRADVVAQGMFNTAQLNDEGVFIYESDEIKSL